VLIATLSPNAKIGGTYDVSTTYTLPTGGLQAVRASFRKGSDTVPCTTGGYDDHDDLVFAVSSGDFTAPVVAFTSPVAGSTTNGGPTITATASDNVGVTRVDFYNGSTLLLSDTTAPYTFQYGCFQGSNTLTAKAYDAAGNAGTASVTWNCERTAPVVTLTSPTAGATVSGTVTLSATATDSDGIARVDFWVDGLLIGTIATPPYSIAWTPTQTGTRRIQASATDGIGNTGFSSQVTVTVTGPSGNAVYDGTLRTAACRATGPNCDSGSLFFGRGTVGAEPNMPNTIGGTCADGNSGTYHSDESMDGLRISTTDNSTLQAGKTVSVSATVWAYSAYTYDQLDLYSAADANNPTWVLIGTFTPPGFGQKVITASYTLPAGPLQAVRAQFRYMGSASPCTAGAYNDRDDLVFAVAP